jgi:NAD-dependent SIR2 family protein deacetylase
MRLSNCNDKKLYAVVTQNVDGLHWRPARTRQGDRGPRDGALAGAGSAATGGRYQRRWTERAGEDDPPSVCGGIPSTISFGQGLVRGDRPAPSRQQTAI